MIITIIFLTFFTTNTFYKVPESTLNNIELSDIGYGFQSNDVTYLSYMARMVGLNGEGEIIGTFDKKGSGPGELKTGGPIFMIGGKVFCYDVMGFKLSRFSSSLEFEKEGSLKNYSVAQIFFFNDGENLFSLSRNTSGGTNKLILEQWHTKTLEAMPEKHPIDFQSKLDMVPITVQFFNEDQLIFFEKYQIEEQLEGYTLDLKTRELKLIQLPNPDYDSRASGKSKNNYFSLMQFSTEIRTLTADDKNIYCFTINFDPGQRSSAVEAGYRMVTIDKSSMEIMDLKAIPFISISGFHNNPVQVMKNQDGGVVVAHPRHFLDR